MTPTEPHNAGLEAVGHGRHGLRLVARLVRDEHAARTRGSVLGWGWAILLPLAESAIYALVFAAAFGRGRAEYAALVLIGVLAWRVLARALSTASTAASRHAAALVTVPEISVAALALAAVGASFLEGLLGAPVAIAVGALVIGPPDFVNLLLWLPAAVALHVGLAAGLALVLIVANAYYRDVGIALGPVLAIAMFAAPVVYAASRVPERWRWLYLANPFSAALECYRAALFGTPAPPALSLWLASGLVVALLWSGLWLAQRLDARVRELV